MLEFHQPGGEAAHKGIAGTGGVHHLDVVGMNAHVDIRLGDKAAAGTQRDNDDRNLQAAAELVQGVRGERMQGGLGKLPLGIEGSGAQQGGTRGKFPDQNDELAFVGNQDLGMPEHGRIKFGPHRRRVEHRDGAVPPRGAQDESDRAVVGFRLAHDNLRGREQMRRDVARPQAEVGAEGDNDLVLAGAVDGDHGRAGGVLGLFDEVGVDAGFPGNGLRPGPKDVPSDGPEEEGGDACARSGHGLVEALAARTGPEITDHGFARLRKLLRVERQILDETADDDDRMLHEKGKLDEITRESGLIFLGSGSRPRARSPR